MPSAIHRSRAGCGALAAFVLLVLGGYLVWANQPLPLERNERTLPQPNGFLQALDAAAQLTRSRPGSPIVDRTFTDAKVLREQLEPEKPHLDALRKSFSVEWGIPPVQDISQKFPYMPALREGARKSAAESRLALAEGRPGEAAQRALDAIELGVHVGRRAPLIHYLVGLSASAIGIDQADRVTPQLSAAEAKAAGTRLDRIIANFPHAADAFREERWVALSTLHRIFRGELDPRVANPELVSSRPRSRPPWFLYPKPWSYRSMDRGFRAYIAEAEKPYPERRRVAPPRDLLAQLLLPMLNQALLAGERNQASLRILRTELALQEFRSRHGRYPERLVELGPEPPPGYVTDPYSHQPLRYRRTQTGYRLYSVGPDGKDDGGQPLLGDATQPNSRGDLVAGDLGTRKRR